MKHILSILFLFLTFSAIAQDKTVVMPNGSSIPEWVNLTEIESTLTPGSVIFAGTSGVLSQDATNLFFENSTDRMGIGANAGSIGTEASLTTIRSFNGLSPGIWSVNSSTGTSAVTILRAGNNAGNVFDMRMHSTTHSSLPAAGMMLATGSGGLYLSTESTQTIFVSNSGSSNILARFTNTGVGIAGVTVPSAMLHLPAGTATAGTAPLKFTTGTALTSPSDGAMEYHSSHLYFTIGSTRYQLDQQGGGITNGAANNELPMSDGTNLDPSGLFIPAAGDLNLGSSALSGANRIVAADGSSPNVGLFFTTKGSASMAFDAGPSGFINVGNGRTASLVIDHVTSTATFSFGFTLKSTNGSVGVPNGYDFPITAGAAYTTGNNNGGNVIITSGAKNGSGVDGNITIDSLTGYLIISTIPTSSAGLPSGAVWANSNVLTIVP